MTERLIFDCDLHNDWSDANVLKPYLEPVWRDYLERGERPGHNKGFPAGHRPWLHPEDFRRSDIRPQTDDEHYTYMKEHHLDKYNITMGLLNGEEAIEASTLANPHYATALTNAYNSWMIETWLPRDDRFVASLVVAPQDPQGAAKEIRRIGDHPDSSCLLSLHTRPQYLFVVVKPDRPPGNRLQGHRRRTPQIRGHQVRVARARYWHDHSEAPQHQAGQVCLACRDV